MVKNLPANAGFSDMARGPEDPLEKEMATHSSMLAWKIPWMEEPGGLSPWGRKESGTTERLTLTIYPKCIGFPETSLNKGKRKIQSKSTHNSYSLNLTWKMLKGDTIRLQP